MKFIDYAVYTGQENMDIDALYQKLLTLYTSLIDAVDHSNNLLLKIMICEKLSPGPKSEYVKDRYTNVIKLKQHLHDVNKLGKSAWSLASTEPVRVRKANFKA